MPILLYCVTNREVQVGGSLSGVAGVSVDPIDRDGLVVFASREADPNIWLSRELRTSAVEFHRVLNQIFLSAAIIPFRFPTISESDEQLRRHLQDKSSHYATVLAKFADFVQMEIRVSTQPIKFAESGTDYLKRRQSSTAAREQFVGRMRETLGSVSKDWQLRTSGEMTRCFALVMRRNVLPFQNSMSAIRVPNHVQVRVSGPWPATEFMEEP